MAIVKQGSTTLNAGAKGDKGDAGIGGGASPLVKAVTNQAELTEPLGVGITTLSIQENITLDADITIPDGAILEYGGGTIDVNGKKVLFQNNSFGKMHIDDKLFDFSYFGRDTQGYTASEGDLNWTLDVIADYRLPVTITVNGSAGVHNFNTSYFNQSLQNIDFKEMVGTTLNNNFALTAGDLVVVTYTRVDDFSRIDQNSTFNVDFVWAKWFGLVDTNDVAQFDNKNVFDAALFAARGATLYINKGHYYKSIVEWNPSAVIRPNNLITDNTNVIGMGKTDTRISMIANHGVIKGNAFIVENAPAGSFQNIWMDGDFLTTLNTQNEHKHAISLEGRSDDFVIKGNRLSYFTADGVHSIPSGNFETGKLVFEDGDIDDSGLDRATSKDEKRSALKGMSSDALELGHGMITYGGYAGYGNLGSVSLRMFFYNANGDFVSKTRYVMTYKDIRIPEGATQMRVVISKTSDGASPTQMEFRGSAHSLRVQIRDNEIDHNFRNGCSNLPAQCIVDGNYIYRNGGRAAGPGYGLGIEDGYMELCDITISNNVFEDNAVGAITLRWVRDINIFNNKFIGYDGSEGINARETWATRIYNNKMYSGTVSAGRQTIVESNEFFDSSVKLPNSQSKAVNNVFFNSYLTGNEADKPDGSVSENNTFYVERQGRTTDDSNQVILVACHGALISRNDNVILREENDFHENWFGSFSSEATGADDIPRSIENFTMTGSYIPHSSSGMKLPYQPIKNSSFNMPLNLMGGRPVSPTLKDNEYTGFIQFGTAGEAGVGRTVSIIGGVLNTSNVYGSSFGWTALRTKELDINLYFEDFTINATDKVASNIMILSHSGTTVFKNCTFNNDTDALNVTQNNADSTCPSIHFVDCTMPTTTTLRIGNRNQIVFETVYKYKATDTFANIDGYWGEGRSVGDFYIASTAGTSADLGTVEVGDCLVITAIEVIEWSNNDIITWTNLGQLNVSGITIGGTQIMNSTITYTGNMEAMTQAILDNITALGATAYTYFIDGATNRLNIDYNTDKDYVFPEVVVTMTTDTLKERHVNSTSDKVRFTKPHINLPVYADNATARADDYNVDGDVYRTTTGEYKIVYTP